MLLQLLVSVFERAKSKITSTRSTGRTSSESDDEFDPHQNDQRILSSGPSIIHQQPRLSISKWLCTTSASVDNPIITTKTPKFRRSTSWRSLKERGNHPVEHFSSRTLSADELHRNDKQYHQSLPVRAQRLSLVRHSPIITLTPQRAKISRRSHRRKNQPIFSRTNTNSGGGDSGYSEESFATTTLSSYTRPLHKSCPHCHCEQRSSFQNYNNKSLANCSTDSPSSDTTINKENTSSDFFQHKQSLSASRSYPHIKPLPRTTSKPSLHQQQRRPRTLSAKRRRHLSSDSSQQPSRVSQHFTTIGMVDYKPFSTLPKTSHVFGELNLAAIELDSLHASLSSSYSSSLTSSSSSINTEEKSRKSSRKKGMYLVWHEYQNSSLLSTTNGTKIFSVIRGDQVRLLRRIGKSTLLVQKEDDGSIGFLPQSCLAHDQINSFLSVKGLRETVL